MTADALSLLGVFALAAAFVRPGESQTRDDRDWSRETAREVPTWVPDAVVYEVFPRAFSTRGDLAGVTARLDHIRDLGATVVWLMPIHPIGMKNRKGSFGSPYAVSDYYAVDQDYGTRSELTRLVREAHARGLKVILDLVANHTAWDNVLMKDPDLYVRDDLGRIQPPNPDWSDVAKLDYSNPKTRAYMIAMMVYWVREHGIDGFRCDVAGLVPTDFWEEARRKLETLRSDLLLLAEWSSPDLMVHAFDVDYAWPFHAALTRVLSLGAPASQLREAWEQERRSFPRGTLHLRFSDNHDEKRAIVRFGEPAALAAQALVLAMDGVPLVYNGMEFGDSGESGGPALVERVPLFWPIAERRPEFPRFYREMIALRREHPALRQGATEWLANSQSARVVSFLRRDEHEEILFAVNLSSQPVEAKIGFRPLGEFTEITPSVALPMQPGGSVPERAARTARLPQLGFDAWGFRLFRRGPLRSAAAPRRR